MTANEGVERQRALLALVVVQIFFGIHYSVALEVLEHIPAAAWAGVRSASAAGVLVLMAWGLRRTWPRGVRLWLWLTVLSVLGVSLNQVLFLEGLSRSNALHSVLVMSTVPLQTLIWAVLLKQEHLTPHKVFSVLLGASGILVLLEVDAWGTGAAQNAHAGGLDAAWRDAAGLPVARFLDSMAAGDCLMLANAGCFALFLVLSRRVARPLDPLALTASTFVLGTVLVLVYAASALRAVEWSALPPILWAHGAFIVLAATVGTYLLNFYALQRVPASLVGLFIYLQFVIAAAVGVAWRGERFDLRVVIASALVLGGLALRILPTRSPQHRGP